MNPKVLPNAEAVARAAGADDLLAAALRGCRLVIGTSARLRTVA